MPPIMQAMAYISLRKISGTSFINTSRKTPPAAPVIPPMMTATQKDIPRINVFWMPATVKSASPKVSKMNHVLFKRTRCLLNRITMNHAIPVHIIYIDGM